MKQKVLIILLVLTCSRILQGQVWTNLIDSVPNSAFHAVTAVVDSATNKLYLGGDFWALNQFPFYTVRGVVSYNGTTFDTLQSGLDYQDSSSLPIVYSMQMFQNKLYVFGNFKKAGKYLSNGVGRWNGSSWDSLNFQLGLVKHTDVYNNELYIGGIIGNVGGVAMTGVAKYDGINWYNLGHPVPGGAGVSAIKNYNGKLYMAGMVTPNSTNANLSYYDGVNWHPWVGVSGDGNKAIFGMNVIDSMLYIYGRFNSIAGTNCRGLAAYNSNTNTWYGFGGGLSNSTWETIWNVQKVNGHIFVTGNFQTIGDLNTTLGYIPPPYMGTNLATLKDGKWCALGPPFDNLVAGVVGYQNNIYAHGSFRRIGQDTVIGFVRWDGGDSIAACSSPFSLTSVHVGLNEVLASDYFKIYPNPASDKITIEFDSIETDRVKLNLTNTIGQIVFSMNDLSQKQEVDISSLSKGIYFLMIQNDTEQKTFKIIKE